MSEELKQVGRLAMRQEGGNWVAYYALTETMKDAIFLGSIRMNAILNNKKRKRIFMDIMRDIIADILEKETGTRPTWGGEQDAPEHERAGNA